MQKLINVIALTSGLVSASIVGAGGYVYLNSEALIEGAKARVTEEVMSAVTGALPGMLDGALPEIPSLPSTTGGVTPLPSTTGGVVPGPSSAPSFPSSPF